MNKSRDKNFSVYDTENEDIIIGQFQKIFANDVTIYRLFCLLLLLSIFSSIYSMNYKLLIGVPISLFCLFAFESFRFLQSVKWSINNIYIENKVFFIKIKKYKINVIDIISINTIKSSYQSNTPYGFDSIEIFYDNITAKISILDVSVDSLSDMISNIYHLNPDAIPSNLLNWTDVPP